MSSNFDYTVEDVAKAISTIAEGVREQAAAGSLPRSKLKLFYTVLRRTKGYLDAAKHHIRDRNDTWTEDY